MSKKWILKVTEEIFLVNENSSKNRKKGKNVSVKCGM
jgi:hypothetical protein